MSPKAYLTKLESLLDQAHLYHVRETCARVFSFVPLPRLPFVCLDASRASDIDWPLAPYDVTLTDPDAMLLNTLWRSFIHHQIRDYCALSIRCDFGSVLLLSLLGLPSWSNGTALYTHPLEDYEALSRLIARGEPDIYQGLGGRCLEWAALYRSLLEDYPILNRHLAIEPPDMPAPFEVACHLMGRLMFHALYDNQELLRELMALITRVYTLWLHEWRRIVGGDPATLPAEDGLDLTARGSYYIKGSVLLLHDTLVMSLARDHYEQFVLPYDVQLLHEFGGGVAFRGRASDFVTDLVTTRGLSCLYCLQPALNDMTHLMQLTFPRHIVLLGLPARYVPYYLTTGAILTR